MADQDDDFRPERKVAERYGVTTMTVYRWDKDPNLGFPKAVIINRRKYRRKRELIAFERARAAGRAA